MAKKPKRDWLEPPEWWKKWKPLRWVAVGAVLIAIMTWVRQYWVNWEPDEVANTLQIAAPAVPAPLEPLPTAPVAEGSSAEPAGTSPAIPAVSPAAPATTLKPADAPAAERPAATRPQPLPAARPAPPGNPVVAAYTQVDAYRVALMEPFRSYDSLELLSAQFAQAGYTPEVQSNHYSVPDDVPPNNVDRIIVKPFTHLGETGKLTLTLFNNRLFESEFEPDDPEAYLTAIRTKIPLLRKRGEGRVEFNEGPLRLASTLDLAISDVGQALRTRAFILWQDTRLVKQRSEWDEKYAQKAVN